MTDKTSAPLACSFCGKAEYDVRKLVAGPSVFICDECVDLCKDIIDEGSDRPPTRDEFTRVLGYLEKEIPGFNSKLAAAADAMRQAQVLWRRFGEPVRPSGGAHLSETDARVARETAERAEQLGLLAREMDKHDSER